MTFVFLCLLLVIVGSAFVYRGDLLAPWRVFGVVYSLLLAVYYLKLSPVQDAWSLTTHLLLWSSLGIFLAACWISRLLFSISNPGWKFNSGQIRSSLQEDAKRIDWKWYLSVWMFCAVGFLISFVAAAILTKGLPAFDSDPDRARMKFFMTSDIANYGMFLGPISMMLAIEYIFLKSRSRVWWMVLIVTLIIIALYFTIVTRLDLFRFFLFTAVVYNYAKRPLGLGHIAGSALGLTFLFMVVFYIRGNQNAAGTIQAMTRLQLPENLLWFTTPYAYVSNSFWNLDFAFQRYIDGNAYYPLQYGFSLFRAPLFLANLEWPFTQAFGFDTIYNTKIVLIEGYNTVIFIWHLFKDFGVTGVFVLTFGAGWLISVFYWNTLASFSVFRMALLGLFIGPLVFSFMVPLWEFWFLYLNLVVIFVAHRKLRLA